MVNIFKKTSVSVIVIVLVLIITSCEKPREPIYHLFDWVHVYPTYDEVKLLVDAKLVTSISFDTTFYTGKKDNVEIIFVVTDKKYMRTKIARQYITKFDTLVADEQIKALGAKKISPWIKTETSYYGKANYDGWTSPVVMKTDGDRAFLETKFDLYHDRTATDYEEDSDFGLDD